VFTGNFLGQFTDMLQGLLANLETNVQYFNDVNNDDDTAANAKWANWGDNGWLSKTGFITGQNSRQRLTRYANDQPIKLQGVNLDVSYAIQI